MFSQTSYKKCVYLVLGIATLAAVVLGFFKQRVTYNTSDHAVISLIANHRKLSVEVVNTPQSREQGLSGRRAIGQEGMLFIYPHPQLVYFWMKGMLFDLDLIWIKNHKVVAVTPQVPHPRTDADNIPLYFINQPIDAVLEVPAGKAKEWGITPGTSLQWNTISANSN